jgi:hypothetical protein
MLGHADYRRPLKGLYHCGSGAHPGGGVTGAPGHNAAQVTLRDQPGAVWVNDINRLALWNWYRARGRSSISSGRGIHCPTNGLNEPARVRQQCAGLLDEAVDNPVDKLWKTG